MVNIVWNWFHSDIEQEIKALLLSEEIDNKLTKLSTKRLLELWDAVEKEIKIVFTK